MNIPHFQYHLVSASSLHYGFITLGNDKIHRIAKHEDFYKALGYTPEIRQRTGLLAEEFVWDEYRKDGCKEKAAIFQARMIEYLLKHSDTFKTQFEDRYQIWLDSCHDVLAQDNPS